MDFTRDEQYRTILVFFSFVSSYMFMPVIYQTPLYFNRDQLRFQSYEFVYDPQITSWVLLKTWLQFVF
jgi:hypothetical protein